MVPSLFITENRRQHYQIMFVSASVSSQHETGTSAGLLFTVWNDNRLQRLPCWPQQDQRGSAQGKRGRRLCISPEEKW